MKKLSTGRVILWVLAASAMGAVPAMAQPDILLNGGFEAGPTPVLPPDDTKVPPDGMGSFPVNWTLTRMNNHDACGWRFGNGVFYVEGSHHRDGHPDVYPRTGDRFLVCEHEGWYDGGTAEQTREVTPGTYDLELSFYVLLDDDTVNFYISHLSGEIIVNGDSVAAAHFANRQQGLFDYTKLTATWHGNVEDNGSGYGEITVRFTALANGLGATNYSRIAIDDVQLLSHSCGTQHEVENIAPNLVDFVAEPGGPATPITITGSDLTGVNNVRLWRTGFDETTEVLTGSELSTGENSLTANFATNGANDGFYDVIVEQPGCAPRVITGGFQIRDTAMSLNLLQNPSFDSLIYDGDDSDPESESYDPGHLFSGIGNTQIWFGDYNKDPAWYPDPIDGEHWFWSYWSNARGWGAQETESTRTWQTVRVAPGSAVTFHGFIDCSSGYEQSGLSTATLTVYDGAGPEPPEAPTNLLGSVTIDQDTVGTYGDWTEVNISGTADSGQVTVEFTTELNSQNGDAAAFADAFSLTVSPLCVEEVYARYAYPGRGPHDQDTTVTIRGGSTLDTVPIDGVKLVFVDAVEQGDEEELIVPGSIITQDPTELTVSFPIATNGVPQGLYNLVIEKDNCPSPNLVDTAWTPDDPDDRPPAQTKVPQTFVDKFEVCCSNTTVFSVVDPNWNIGETVKQLRIVGPNVTELTGVSLVHVATGTPVDGYDLSTDGDDLLAWFDFSSAPNGAYGIQGVRGADGCNDPDSIMPIPDEDYVFRYHSAGSNLLLNGDFEEEGPKEAKDDFGGDPPSGDGVVARWPKTPDSITYPRYNGDVLSPPSGAAGGVNYGSVDLGGSGTARIVQTVPVEPLADLTLTGYIYGYTYPTAADHFIKIRDGGDDGPVLADFTFQSGAYPDWEDFTLTEVEPTLSTVTIEWGFIQDAGWQYVSTHVDELVLTQETLACTHPYAADADDDGDVDQDDFGVFQACSDAVGGPIPGSDITGYTYDCRCFDVAGGSGDPPGGPDGILDNRDYTEFDTCAAGPGVPIPAACRM